MFNYNNAFQSNGLDFATVKYIRTNGRFGWNPTPIKFFNFNDTASGIDDNPVTKINYELPVERIGNSFYDVKLTVYNTLGAEVATLVNEKQNAGRHSVTFNAVNLSSGIYFYELSLNGIPIMTKRMLLVK